MKNKQLFDLIALKETTGGVDIRLLSMKRYKKLKVRLKKFRSISTDEAPYDGL